jgi:N-acyl-phosphatidylethanolamine-hydrolysing phospholipase D
MEEESSTALPAHHRPGGGFRNPWPGGELTSGSDFWRWQRERRRADLPPNPDPRQLPRAEPDIARPRAETRELRITWVGHATFLLQVGGLNLLTDPHWSPRASPLPFAGPRRVSAPGIAWDDLPAIDAVLLSHDHYDHLDSATARRLRRRFGAELPWFTPLGYRRWMRWRGVRVVREMDWWEEAGMPAPGGALRLTALPAQHWTNRATSRPQSRLWCSWAVAAPGGPSLFFSGDTGYFPGFAEIGERLGPLTAALLPIGAYEPRWFMRGMHMNPEDAVRAYRDLGGSGSMLPTHWGSWRLTDEDPLEPPVRVHAAWRAAGLPAERLRVLAHGETWIGGSGGIPPARNGGSCAG